MLVHSKAHINIIGDEEEPWPHLWDHQVLPQPDRKKAIDHPLIPQQKNLCQQAPFSHSTHSPWTKSWINKKFPEKLKETRLRKSWPLVHWTARKFKTPFQKTSISSSPVISCRIHSLNRAIGSSETSEKKKGLDGALGIRVNGLEWRKEVE